MELLAIAVALGFILIMFLGARSKAQKIRKAIADAKVDVSEESGMTASVGLFSPGNNTTVIIGASEEKGALYYRLLQGGKILNSSRINLSNLSRVDLLIGSQVHEFDCFASGQPTTSLKSTEVTGTVLSQFTPATIKAIRRAAVRISFVSESGDVKTLEIIAVREENREGNTGVQALKNAIWWVAFLNIASRNCRHKR